MCSLRAHLTQPCCDFFKITAQFCAAELIFGLEEPRHGSTNFVGTKVFTIKQFVIRLHNLDILDILVLTSMNKA